jgi:hypothetical protein
MCSQIPISPIHMSMSWVLVISNKIHIFFQEVRKALPKQSLNKFLIPTETETNWFNN